MYISELLKGNQPSISFEVFPPKTDDAYEMVTRSVGELASLKPDFMSVTYGAGGGTSKNTVRIASELQDSHGMTALAHLSCVSSTREEVSSILNQLQRSNISNVLALGGDRVARPDRTSCPDDYHYAYELVRDIKKNGSFCIGAACYPEGHIHSDSIESDLKYLAYKVDQGVDFLVSQMFFDNRIFCGFLERIQAKAITVPVLAGIMPVVSAKLIDRMLSLSGTKLTPKLEQLVEKWGDSPQDMQKAGVDYASEQISDLVNRGVRGIHLYTMNRPEVAREILDNTKLTVNR
ncbi:MAG: methylenetetrahydrofolate reductase [NAD(P)H] [Clostridiaceae bacterium]|nr:methylenetetrahydrofolate reductase [NAD(P)H] [Clostridiaceae bacterium]